MPSNKPETDSEICFLRDGGLHDADNADNAKNRFYGRRSMTLEAPSLAELGTQHQDLWDNISASCWKDLINHLSGGTPLLLLLNRRCATALSLWRAMRLSESDTLYRYLVGMPWVSPVSVLLFPRRVEGMEIHKDVGSRVQVSSQERNTSCEPLSSLKLVEPPSL
jgi:hypothetical protein